MIRSFKRRIDSAIVRGVEFYLAPLSCCVSYKRDVLQTFKLPWNKMKRSELTSEWIFSQNSLLLDQVVGLFGDFVQTIEGCFRKIETRYTHDRLILRAVYILWGLYRPIKADDPSPWIILERYGDRKSKQKNYSCWKSEISTTFLRENSFFWPLCSLKLPIRDIYWNIS